MAGEMCSNLIDIYDSPVTWTSGGFSISKSISLIIPTCKVAAALFKYSLEPITISCTIDGQE